MANVITNIGKDYLLQAGNWVADNIDVFLVDSASFTYSAGVTDYLDTVPGGMRIASASLASKTCVAGLLDAANATFTSVSGAQFEYLLVVARLGGAETADPILMVFDSATGLPLTPNGNNITLTWDASGIVQF